MLTLPPVLSEADLAGITDVTHDSKAVIPGSMFACVIGQRFDGHDFASGAVASGASALLVERRVDVDPSIRQVVVPDVRAAMGFAAAHVHGWPARDLNLVGVTGTNGKTTTTQMLASLLRNLGQTTESLGTLSGARTTPESPELQRTLASLVDAGATNVVMEVSSHAMVQHRVDGCRFAAAVFTNLGRDHLDLHGTMEEYFRAKASLFVLELTDVAVVNRDDRYGQLLADSLRDSGLTVVAFSTTDLSDIEVGVDRIRFVWRDRRVEVPIGGDFNVQNALAALETAVATGTEVDDAADAISEIGQVPGRFETVDNDGGFSVVVDYAHTPDGITELLRASRHISGAKRVIVVFGCGGDRDREKRPMMGAAAAEGADIVIITSDNPRHEDPLAIIRDAAAGMPVSVSPQIEVDRRGAIASAFAQAQPGDVVVIAGKGHETTQTIGDTAFPFDDRVVAKELLEEMQ